jgi:tetratricopeptide (TPR) repeat protein
MVTMSQYLSKSMKPRSILFFLILILALLTTACSASAEKLNKEGNQAFSKQVYQQALEAYQSAQIESPELAEPYYNAANAYYRQGDYAKALEQISQALNFIDDESLAESSLFNLGNNLYNSQELETAVAAYTEALLINPEDQDAKYNLELALQQQQEQQQEEEQQNQEENQDQQNDQSENGDQNEQQDQQDQSQGSEGEQQEDQQEDGDQQNDQNQGQDPPQPQENEDQSQNQQPQPADGEMTREQAQQLLAAIAQNMQTLQEKLGQFLLINQLPPLQDW